MRLVVFRLVSYNPICNREYERGRQNGGRSETDGQAPREEAVSGLRAKGHEARPLLRRQRALPEGRSLGRQAVGAEARHPRAATYPGAGRMRARLPRRSAGGRAGEPQGRACRRRSSRSAPTHDRHPDLRGCGRDRHRSSPARLEKREACRPVGCHPSRLRVPTPWPALRRGHQHSRRHGRSHADLEREAGDGASCAPAHLDGDEMGGGARLPGGQPCG